jgi:DNA-directed RNA polymerase alpha subunit
MSTVHDPRLLDIYDLIPKGSRIATLAVNSLWRAGIETVGWLVERSEEDLLREVRNFGPACLAIVKAALAEHGLTLKAAT